MAVEVEIEDPPTLIEEREEKMVMVGSSIPIRRKATFLKPCITSMSEAPELPSFPVSETPISQNLKKWPSKVLFNGWRNPQKKWKQWVDELNPIYGPLWKQLGIHDAIMGSTYKLCQDQELILGLAEFWCSDTNTFVFQWGEATITLEDMLVLGGYPVLGEPITCPLSGELLEVEEKLRKERSRIYKCYPGRKIGESTWINHFMGNNNNEFEHIAFLSLWLSRYVFPTQPLDTVGMHVFSIAIRLAHGRRIALAPAVLASIYRDLRLLKENISCNSECITVWGPLQLLHMWGCEHFPSLNSNNPSALSPSEPRPARWHDLRSNSELWKICSTINSLENFQWRPYTSSSSINWRCPSFYKDREELLNVEGEDEELRSFACCLRGCNIVGLDCTTEKYLPHRVARQFGFDQDIPGHFLQSNVTCELAYDKPIENVDFFVRSRFVQSSITERYHLWWTSSVARLDRIDDISDKQEIPKRCKRKAKVPVECMMKPTEKSIAKEKIIPHPSEINVDSKVVKVGASGNIPFNNREKINTKSVKQESFNSYKTGDQVSEEWKMKVRNLSLPPGLAPQKSKQVASSPTSTIQTSYTRVIPNPMNSNVDIKALGPSVGRSHEEVKEAMVGDSKDIPLGNKEDINTDGMEVPGAELEVRISKLEVLTAKLKEQVGSMVEQTGDGGTSHA